jgi:hypothetical protein
MKEHRDKRADKETLVDDDSRLVAVGAASAAAAAATAAACTAAAHPYAVRHRATSSSMQRSHGGYEPSRVDDSEAAHRLAQELIRVLSSCDHDNKVVPHNYLLLKDLRPSRRGRGDPCMSVEWGYRGCAPTARGSRSVCADEVGKNTRF